MQDIIKRQFTNVLSLNPQQLTSFHISKIFSEFDGKAWSWWTFYLFSQTFTEKKMDLSLLPNHKITIIIIRKEKDKLQKERKNNQNYENMHRVFSLRTA